MLMLVASQVQPANAPVPVDWNAAIASVASVISCLAAVYAVVQAHKAARMSLDAGKISEAMFRRQHVIDLHLAWRGVAELDMAKPIGPDILRAANALELTSSLWNHDIVEREILFQSYWDAFSYLYERIKNSDVLVPGSTRTCASLISKEIDRAYEDMKSRHLGSVKQTSLRGQQ